MSQTSVEVFQSCHIKYKANLLTIQNLGKLQCCQAWSGWAEQHAEPGGRQVQHPLQRDRAHGCLQDDQGDHP